MHKAKKVSGNDATKQTKMQQKKRKKVRNKLQKMSGPIRSRKQELAMYYRNTMLNIQLLQSLLLWQIETPADMRGKL